MMSEVLLTGIAIGMILQFMLDRTLLRGIATGRLFPEIARWLARRDRS